MRTEARSKKQEAGSSTNRWMLVVVLALAFSSVFGLRSSVAQDVHFSQFYTNPLIMNPAHTGYFNGNYRIGFNFKAQWPFAIGSAPYNYHTETPFIDFSFLEKKIKRGWMGIGAHFLNDEAGDGQLTYRRFGLSYAYHQSFDKDDRYTLSAGIGLSYIIRSVDFEKFYFNNQWEADKGFNLSLSPYEPINTQSFHMLDMSVGLHFGAQVTDNFKLGIGASMLHINRPKHSFYNQKERLGFRFIGQLDAEAKVGEAFRVYANVYYTIQKKASEAMLGAMCSYGVKGRRELNPKHAFYFGVYYRIKDALAPVVGYSFRQTRLLVSYDITLSSLLTASRSNGGPEISLVHVGPWERGYNRKVYCPRF